ncbi:ribosomal protein L11 methyltransferase [Maioricimonas rarisocia]|uniref:Ribosomal protein L11 methyltransferase n=1 Tax=Maioricimonas rarisocia TaxID=2528026 RepID=A0A517Z6X7_9PLAN|nr:methyltransferase [Maioricimonas rarisocia]QDU38181.1 ribosomal protein L11 methyltransferase [Maioricimonas rarisocia]
MQRFEGGVLPAIPGGWTSRTIPAAGREFRLVLPADPDAMLDDPAVLAANEVNDYMPYWSYLWPAASIMCDALRAADWPPGTEVIELGAGVGLVGLAALSLGWRVTFSDYDETALELCRINATANGFPEVGTLNFDWRAPIDRQFPVILGCEIIYDAHTHDAVLDVIERMLPPGGVCWLGDPGRSQAPRFAKKAEDAGFRVQVRNEQGLPDPDASVDGFRIYELRRVPA